MCRSYDTLEVVRLDDRDYKFLYAEGKRALCIKQLYPQACTSTQDVLLCGADHLFTDAVKPWLDATHAVMAFVVNIFNNSV